MKQDSMVENLALNADYTKKSMFARRQVQFYSEAMKGHIQNSYF